LKVLPLSSGKKSVDRLGIAQSTVSNKIGFSPLILPEDKGRSILQNIVIFKVLRFLSLFKKQTMDKVQNKGR
jgi:hypothetical protein